MPYAQRHVRLAIPLKSLPSIEYGYAPEYLDFVDVHRNFYIHVHY